MGGFGTELEIVNRLLKVIGVNSTYSKVAQRFTAAHELGHYLCGHEHIENTFIDDERRYYEQYFHTEKEADAFAGELLMPKTMLEKDLSEHGIDIAWLKERYQVSEQALWIRLTSLRLTDKYSHIKPKTDSK
jgi:Zn-dependent peptidase ImmA (M78 family)